MNTIEFGCLILCAQPDGKENNISFLISKFFLFWHEFYLKVYLLWLLYQGKGENVYQAHLKKLTVSIAVKTYLWFLSSSLFLASFWHHCNLIFYPTSSACKACASCLCCLPRSWILCIKRVLTHFLSTQHCTHRNPLYICTGLTDSPLQGMRQAKKEAKKPAWNNSLVRPVETWVSRW